MTALSRETEPKLLSMLLQVALYGRELVWVSRTKSSILINIDEARVLKMQDHIWMMVAIHINEAECDRDQVITAAIELRPDVDARF